MTKPNAAGYYFGWGKDHEFQVKIVGPNGVPNENDEAVWRTNVKLPFANNIFVKITDDGHINVYADNVYDYFGSLSKNEIVWSSLPFRGRTTTRHF
jgi:hypothetical protein